MWYVGALALNSAKVYTESLYIHVEHLQIKKKQVEREIFNLLKY